MHLWSSAQLYTAIRCLSVTYVSTVSGSAQAASRRILIATTTPSTALLLSHVCRAACLCMRQYSERTNATLLRCLHGRMWMKCTYGAGTAESIGPPPQFVAALHPPHLRTTSHVHRW